MSMASPEDAPQEQAAAASARRKGYKGQPDVSSARRRRQTLFIQLRKSRRQDTLSKCRRHEHASTSSPSPTAQHQHQSPSAKPSDPPPPPPPPPGSTTADAPDHSNSLLPIISGLESDNTSLQLQAALSIRKILSADNNYLAEEVIRTSVVARLVELLSISKNPQLQLETAWALTNITAGSSEHTELVTNAGAVPKLVKLLESAHCDVREQAMWALGNIAADSQRCRENVIDQGGLVQLLSQFNEHAKVSTIRMATWTLSNICFGEPPSKSQTKAVLEILQQLLNSIDEKILSDTCWAVSYLCNHGTDEIQMIIESHMCPQLVKLLMHSSLKVVTPATLAISYISTADNSQVQCLLDNGILQCLLKLLNRDYQKNIKKQACMIISNICAGTGTHIQAIIDSKIVPILIQLSHNGLTDIKRESTWAIANAASGGSPEQIWSLVGDGCISALCNGLKFCDPDLLYACLNGLENILNAGEMKKTKEEGGTNTCAVLVEECGGLEKLENLQDFDNDNIYEKTMKLLESYWVEESSEGEAAEEPSSKRS